MHFKQYCVEEEFPRRGPLTEVLLKALLDEILQNGKLDKPLHLI